MVINSTNIKKMNNQRITLILAELTEHIETTTCDIGNSGPGCGQAQKCGGVKQITEITTHAS
jgi:hypothetical protein